MNQYKVWQVALIYSVLIFGIIYALPNFFPTKPAIQIAFGDSLKANNTNIISDLTSELENKNVAFRSTTGATSLPPAGWTEHP